MSTRFFPIALAAIVLAGFGVESDAWAQEATPAAQPTTPDSEEQRHKAVLVANLAEYGYMHDDPLALLSAAKMLAGMDSGVAKRDVSHDADARDHGTEGLFDVDAMVKEALTLAADYPQEDASSIRRIAAQVSQGSKGYLGYLHTHYVWQCNYNYWRRCGYVWFSHY